MGITGLADVTRRSAGFRAPASEIGVGDSGGGKRGTPPAQPSGDHGQRRHPLR